MSQEVVAIMESFDLSAGQLAKVLGVPTITIDRWVRGDNQPKGTYAAVLHGLHAAAQLADQRGAEAQLSMRASLMLGIGTLIQMGLTEKLG